MTCIFMEEEVHYHVYGDFHPNGSEKDQPGRQANDLPTMQPCNDSTM